MIEAGLDRRYGAARHAQPIHADVSVAVALARARAWLALLGRARRASGKARPDAGAVDAGPAEAARHAQARVGEAEPDFPERILGEAAFRGLSRDLCTHGVDERDVHAVAPVRVPAPGQERDREGQGEVGEGAGFVEGRGAGGVVDADTDVLGPKPRLVPVDVHPDQNLRGRSAARRYEERKSERGPSPHPTKYSPSAAGRVFKC